MYCYYALRAYSLESSLGSGNRKQDSDVRSGLRFLRFLNSFSSQELEGLRASASAFAQTAFPTEVSKLELPPLFHSSFLPTGRDISLKEILNCYCIDSTSINSSFRPLV